MRLFVYLITFLSVLLTFVSGICGWMFMATGYAWFGLLVGCIVSAGLTAILGWAVWDTSRPKSVL